MRNSSLAMIVLAAGVSYVAWVGSQRIQAADTVRAKAAQTQKARQAVTLARAEPRRTATAHDSSGLAKANNAFAIDLYQQLKSESGNLIFSPASISVALAMTYTGAGGETKSQMAKVLHFDKEPDQVHAAMSKLLVNWKSTEKDAYQLTLANRLWGKQGFVFRDQYLSLLRDHYSADLTEVDFNKSEEVRQMINNWVADATEQKIKNLIPQGLLNARMRLVLTNAVYFDGVWAHPFEKERTRPGDFHIQGEQVRKVPMMHQSLNFSFAQVDGLQVLEMPYKGGNLSMVVLLPKEKQGLSALEEKLTHANLERWLDQLKPQKVVVTFPRFKAESSFSLADKFAAMGMTAAFDPSQADFSGMTESEKLFISAVLHKGFVEVEEKGTKAAAATAVIAETTAFRSEPPPEFTADHPFLFLIRDRKTASILFLGRVVEPGEVEK